MLPLTPATVAVTVCGPALVAVQALPVHDPSAVIAKVLEAVALPMSFPAASYASTVNDSDPPAVRVAPAGLTAIWSTAGVWYSRAPRSS